MRDFGKDVFWGLTKSETHCQTIVSVSFTKERWTQKLSGILLNYYYYFLIGLFLGLRSGPLDLFWARV